MIIYFGFVQLYKKLKSYIIAKYIAPPSQDSDTKKYLTATPVNASPNKMPHPRFDTQWEENSYWKHYTNYMESKLDDAELELARHLELDYIAAAAQRKPQQKQKRQQKQQPPSAQESEGWTLVTRGRRRGQNK